MMRSFLYLCSVFAVAVGCASFDEESSLAPTNGAHHTISAVTDISPLSRAGFERVEGVYKHFWEANDEISLLSASGANGRFALIEGAGGNSGKFSGYADLGNGEIFAVYPYNEKTSLSGSTLSVEYPAEQIWRADKASYDKDSYLMVANGTLAGLKFKNITAVVRLSLTGKATITKVELRSIGREAIAGKAEVCFANGEPKVVLAGAENRVVLNVNTKLTSEAQHLFVAIPPMALSKGFEVTIYDSEGYVMTKSSSSTRTIKRNTVIEMPTFAYVATDKISEMVTDAECVKEATVSEGYSFMVKSRSFVEGDKLRLRSYAETYECATQIYPDGASLTIPAGFESGIYNLELVRGDAKQVLAEVDLTASVVPQADMLDVVFHPDGSAHDGSAMQSEIVYKAGDRLLTYSSTAGRYVAKFSMSPGQDDYSSNFYYVPYVKTEAFGLKQADGHSFECVASISEVENVSCLMATHQSGGTAFRFQAAEREGVTNAMQFVPYVGGAYKYATGPKAQMELNKFYHFVGVWNKESGDIVLYVNGEQAGIVKGCTGAFKDSKVPTLVIGGDPNSSAGVAQNAWNGDIALARVYDKPLSANEAKILYDEALKVWPHKSNIKVSKVRLFSGLEVAEGWKFSIYGDGIEAGDTISLESSVSGLNYSCSTTSTKGRSTIVIPQGLPSDTYKVVLHRGDDKAVIASTVLAVTADALLPRKPKNVAHRGCWYVDGVNNVPENSIAGLQRAQTMEGVYSVEFDVWMTADDVLVINHDASIGGVTIQSSNYSAIENITLSNGEKLPTLEAYLNEYVKNSSIKMLLHLKNHSTTARTKECIDATVVMLRERGILAKTEWLVSTYDVAKYIINNWRAEVPDLVVACSGVKHTSTYPELGNGIILNYEYTTVDANPSAVKQAHLRGLEMVVWPITHESEMLKYMSLGIDYFNCNSPALLAELNKLTFVEE